MHEGDEGKTNIHQNETERRGRATGLYTSKMYQRTGLQEIGRSCTAGDRTGYTGRNNYKTRTETSSDGKSYN